MARLKDSALRVSVQSMGVIDGAITALLLVTVLLIAILVPSLSPPNPSPWSLSVNEISRENGNKTLTYFNSTDSFWWHLTRLQNYQSNLRSLGNVLDATFMFILFIIVVADIVLVSAADGLTERYHAQRLIYYWQFCNTLVVLAIPVVSVLSIQISAATGILHECGLGCGLPYFYIIYRVLFGLMVIMYLCELKRNIAEQPVDADNETYDEKEIIKAILMARNVREVFGI